MLVVGRTSACGWVSAPFVFIPSDGVFGRFILAALRGCHTLNFCLFVCFMFAVLMRLSSYTCICVHHMCGR
jgi:hypothetical protein